MTKKKTKPRLRRTKGTGAFFWSESKQRYIGRVPFGRNPDGTTAYVQRESATEKGLLEKLRVAEPPGPKTTVAEWGERWIAGLTVEPRTVDSYANSVRKYITPTLGPTRLTDLSAHQIETAAKKWGKSIKTNTVLLVLSHLQIAMKAAMRAKLIKENPVSLCLKPPGEETEIDPFSPDEVRQIAAHATGKPNVHIVAILALTGCRCGEAIALDVSDWDAATGMISITKTQSQVKSRGAGKPKSKHSTRTIRVPLAARPAITAAIGKRKRGPIFVTGKGNRLVYQLLRRAWYIVLKRLKLRRRNPHQLRHSAATRFISEGVPIGDVAEYLGDTAETIVRTYLHPSGSDPSLVMDRIYGEKIA